MSVKNFFIGCLVGGVAGGISELALNISSVFSMELLSLFITPGIVFGIITIFYFAFFAKRDGGVMQPLTWIFMSGLSYFVAVLVTLQGPKGVYCCAPTPLAYLLGGLVGASLLVFSFHFLINRVSVMYVGLTIVFGGVLAMLRYDFTPVFLQSYLFYGIWQAGICGLLAASQKDVVLKK